MEDSEAFLWNKNLSKLLETTSKVYLCHDSWQMLFEKNRYFLTNNGIYVCCLPCVSKCQVCPSYAGDCVLLIILGGYIPICDTEYLVKWKGT